MHVNFEKWISEDGNPLIVDGAEVRITISCTGTGLASGGAPYKVGISAVGDKNVHKYLKIHSIVLKTSSGEEIVVGTAEGIKEPFAVGGMIAYRQGKHGLYFLLKDKIDIDYKKTDEIICFADISIERKDGKIKRESIEKKFIKDHYDKWEWIFPTA